MRINLKKFSILKYIESSNDIVNRKENFMAKKNQSTRLTSQHKESKGVIGIFGEEAKNHDIAVGEISKIVKSKLEEKYSNLEFRYRSTILK